MWVGARQESQLFLRFTLSTFDTAAIAHFLSHPIGTTIQPAHTGVQAILPQLCPDFAAYRKLFKLLNQLRLVH